MITELINSLKVQLNERVSNPVFGTFALSWIAFNYEFIVVVFSKTKIDLKLFILREGLYSGILEHFFYWLIAPLISSTFIIILYPFISFKLYKYWHQSQKELKDIKQKIEDESPLTIADSRKIRGEFAKLQLEYDNERQKFHDQIKLLKSERDQSLTDLSKEIQSHKSARNNSDSLQDEIKRLNGKINNDDDSRKVISRMEKYNSGLEILEKDILLYLYTNRTTVSREMLETKFIAGSVATSLTTVLFNLSKNQFISHNEEMNSYGLLELGEKYLIEHNLISTVETSDQ